MKKNITTARIRADGTLVRVESDGREVPLQVEPIPDLSECEMEAAAASDPDNPPLTPERQKHLRPVPRVKTLRRALGLTQEEFAARYHIPLGTLRDWEQGRTEPDQPARAYLHVIARDPEGVRRALESRPSPSV
jgi:putative transcriptional regulator